MLLMVVCVILRKLFAVAYDVTHVVEYVVEYVVESTRTIVSNEFPIGNVCVCLFVISIILCGIC
jgi:hypothetical protein